MTSPTLTPSEFEALVEDIRPELHRYATRMTGSVIDGEDVVQEAVLKAYGSLTLLTHKTNLRGWLFRITHNKAIDYLRRFSDEPMELLDDYFAPEDIPWQEIAFKTTWWALVDWLAGRRPDLAAPSAARWSSGQG